MAVPSCVYLILSIPDTNLNLSKFFCVCLCVADTIIMFYEAFSTKIEIVCRYVRSGRLENKDSITIVLLSVDFRGSIKNIQTKKIIVH